MLRLVLSANQSGTIRLRAGGTKDSEIIFELSVAKVPEIQTVGLGFLTSSDIYVELLGGVSVNLIFTRE